MSNIEKWELISEVDVSPSKWFPLFKNTVKLPDGKIVDDYYVSKLGDVAMILAITKDKELLFVKQYKHGVQEIILELPAGRVGKKTPDQAAIDELEEETGASVEKMENLGEVFIAPSKDSTKTHAYIVQDVEINSSQKLDETENIEVILIPLNQVEEKIKSGEIKASDTLASIYLAKLRYPDFLKSV